MSVQMAEQEGKRLELLKGLLPSFSRGGCGQSNRGEAEVRSWQCAPKARIISGGRIHPESCRLIRQVLRQKPSLLDHLVGASRHRDDSGMVRVANYARAARAGNRMGWSLVTKVAFGRLSDPAGRNVSEA